MEGGRELHRIVAATGGGRAPLGLEVPAELLEVALGEALRERRDDARLEHPAGGEDAAGVGERGVGTNAPRFGISSRRPSWPRRISTLRARPRGRMFGSGAYENCTTHLGTANAKQKKRLCFLGVAVEQRIGSPLLFSFECVRSVLALSMPCAAG